MLEKVDPGDGGTSAAAGLSCWCWLEPAGTGGESPGADGEYSVPFDEYSLTLCTPVSLNLVVCWLPLLLYVHESSGLNPGSEISCCNWGYSVFSSCSPCCCCGIIP